VFEFEQIKREPLLTMVDPTTPRKPGNGRSSSSE